jgi:hypothetical protein
VGMQIMPIFGILLAPADRAPHKHLIAPSDYHLPGKLKESLRGTRFEDDDAIIMTTTQRLRRAGPEFCRAGIQAL